MTARHQIRVGRLGRDRSPIDTQRAPTLGEMLQAAREKKGVDLYRAERDTKIRARHLASLESGDYAELPGAVYTKGFLRNYALYLGLDPEEVLTRWREEQDFGRRGEPVAVVAPPQPIAEPHRGLTFTPGIVVAALLTVVVLLFAGYVGLQLVRFSQVPEVRLDGPQVMELAADAQAVLLRGSAGPRAVINVSDANGAQLKTTSADDAGRWVVELPVSKGQNDFSIIARDPDTGRESAPLPVVAMVPVPSVATPRPATPGPTGPAATLAPGATATPVPTAGPGLPGASLGIARPTEGADLGSSAVAVSGTTDAASVTIRAAWAGGGGAPRTPPSVDARAKDGSWAGTIVLPEGRWTLTVTTAAAEGLAATSATRAISVNPTGLYVTVEARGGTAWVQVWADTEAVEDGRTFRKGETASFEARRTVVVNTGNAGATFVTVNGEPFGTLGEGGAIATWTFEKGKTPRRQ